MSEHEVSRIQSAQKATSISLNINTILTALVLGGVAYLTSMVTSTNERLIRLEVRMEEQVKQSEKRFVELEDKMKVLENHNGK